MMMTLTGILHFGAVVSRMLLDQHIGLQFLALTHPPGPHFLARLILLVSLIPFPC